MLSKVKNIAITLALSLVVFVSTGVIAAWLGGIVVGTTINSSGEEEIKGGGITALVIFSVCLITSIAFAIWLNKTLAKVSAVNTKESNDKA